MDRLGEKVERSIEILQAGFREFTKPVVYFSGGKDSVVMLHIILSHMRLRLPVIFHREPFALHKYEFGMKMLAHFGLTAFDYPPLKVSLWLGKEILAYTNHYQIGVKGRIAATLDLPKNIIETEHGLCGLKDLIERPTGTFNYPWNLAVIGHKDCDSDQIAGDTHLYADIVRNEGEGGPSLIFPMRHWRHEDIWSYLEHYQLWIQKDRYDALAREELKDKTFNSDYFEACTRCIDKRNDKFVQCPKLNGALVNNVSDRIPYNDLTLPYFGEKASV